ncbi:tRNA (adenosine(37)-N6)-threonylcarbamoyltransferase complex ATPase subunit type 1 TsaE [Legionella clemsonensis]|uniref:tRNA threonylcarbamoyladenosine biosynthesis protein TsaE n=1 Tax=Legionella clemsonensis TaxID=1867846 RepID=A0A222NZQ6_9GAMM|nr:tRNA (adenosine(37)-N6)-threonylcarbamoyltransferase complex ATPase subunit type 1 TsaE [Legionella clemsonensis]ASQ45080.1 tRNA threonylcarbamoyladenosine biosynthesis protein TsaE [Legionella clemsonensis]
MTKTDVALPDEYSSELLAAKLAQELAPPLILTFSGEIGAGKTTFIRAMLRALGITTAIKSPTFSLIESYHCNKFQLHHFDLYRIHDESELEYIGFRDYFREDSVCCIEWPEQAGHFLNKVDMNFSFAIKGHGRLLSIKAASPVGEKLLSKLAGKE